MFYIYQDGSIMQFCIQQLWPQIQSNSYILYIQQVVHVWAQECFHDQPELEIPCIMNSRFINGEPD